MLLEKQFFLVQRVFKYVFTFSFIERRMYNTRRIATPEIKYTPASSSSSSRRSSFNRSPGYVCAMVFGAIWYATAG